MTAERPPDLEKYTLHPVWMELSRPSLEHNWRSIEAVVGQNVTVIPMLKANAYGYGAIPIGRSLQEFGAKYAGVSSLREALELRSSGITIPLLITDYVNPNDLPVALSSWMNTTLIVSDPDMLPAIEKNAQELGRKAKVHLFIDTGMHREGILPQLALPLITKIHQSPHVELEGLMTHLAQPTNPDPHPTYAQLTILNQFLDQVEKSGVPLPPYIHAAEGASVMRFPQTYTGRFTAVRPGNIIYGIIPGGEDFRQYLKFVPKQVLHALKARLANVKKVAAGGEIGYGRNKVDKDTRIGIINIGHADGFRPSKSKNPSYVLVGGKRALVLDREAMNQAIIELPGESYKIGDEVVIIGKQGEEEITLEEVCRAQMGTENLTRFTAQLHATRLPRLLMDK